MSQPTRARMTAAERNTHRATTPPDQTPARSDEQTHPQAQMHAAANPLAPESLARTLRAVAAELERDPALAQRVAEALAASTPTEQICEASRPQQRMSAPSKGVNQSFRPRLVTGTDPALGSGIPDPHALYARGGEAGLRAALAGLRLGSLRAIMREHRLDPGGKLARQNDAGKLRDAIVAAAKRGK